MSMKKRLFAIASCVVIEASRASGVPTVDLTAAANFLLQMQQLAQQYETLKSSYSTQASMLSTMSGNRGYGKLHHNTSLMQMLSDDYRTQFQNVVQSGYSAMSSGAKAIYTSQGFDEMCASISDSERLSECRNEAAVNAEFQYLLRTAQSNNSQILDEITELMSEINSSDDAKGIAELQAQIQAKQSAISIARTNLEMQVRQMQLMSEQRAKLQAEQAAQTAFKRLSDEEIANLLK